MAAPCSAAAAKAPENIGQFTVNKVFRLASLAVNIQCNNSKLIQCNDSKLAYDLQFMLKLRTSCKSTTVDTTTHTASDCYSNQTQQPMKQQEIPPALASPGVDGGGVIGSRSAGAREG